MPHGDLHDPEGQRGSLDKQRGDSTSDGERDWLDHSFLPTTGEQVSFSFGLSQSQDSREVSSWVRRAELREGSWAACLKVGLSPQL